jgi:hypothetical protein
MTSQARSGRTGSAAPVAPTPGAAGTSAAVLELCAEARRKLRGEPAAFVRRIQEGLAEPQLRVALLGRVSSGKSTLVNALLGWRIAPTDAGECTRLITCFRHGDEPSAAAYLRDGRRVRLPSPRAEGELSPPPGHLGDVAFLDVRLPSDPLREVTLMDTPGISSAGSEASQQTHDLVGHRIPALPAADAVAFLLNQSPREDEYALLREVDRSNTLIPASVQTVGILAKADLVGGGGPGAREAARSLARSIAERNQGLLSSVVPLAGLLAEAGNCARLTERDALLLRRLCREWDQAVREVALLSAEMFTSQPSQITAAERRRLIEVFGLAGIRELLRCVDEGLASPAALNAACLRASGYEDLRIALVHNFRERADALKAGRALSALIRAAYGRMGRQLSEAHREWFQDRLESVRFDPRTHRILELQAMHQVLAGQVDLPQVLQDDLIGMVRGRHVMAEALGPASWQEFEIGATSAAQREVARVMVRSYAVASSPPRGRPS